MLIKRNSTCALMWGRLAVSSPHWKVSLQWTYPSECTVIELIYSSTFIVCPRILQGWLLSKSGTVNDYLFMKRASYSLWDITFFRKLTFLLDNSRPTFKVGQFWLEENDLVKVFFIYFPFHMCDTHIQWYKSIYFYYLMLSIFLIFFHSQRGIVTQEACVSLNN